MGGSPLNLWLRRRQEAIELERQVARIAVEVGADVRPPATGTAAGDPKRLRGLPAIGYGVSGAIADTQPERTVLKRLTAAARDASSRSRGDASTDATRRGGPPRRTTRPRAPAEGAEDSLTIQRGRK
jgi:hypothetical protein